jgi:hypothetical protein
MLRRFNFWITKFGHLVKVLINKQVTASGSERVFVDTIRKLVIIAVGGKIGNPPLSCLCQQLTEQGTKGKTPPTGVEHDGTVVPAAVELPKEWARGCFREDSGPQAPYGEAPSGPRLVRLAQAGQGVDNV